MASDGQDGGASLLAASEGVPYAQVSDALQLAVVADNDGLPVYSDGIYIWKNAKGPRC